MTIYDLALKYYSKLWNINRINMLVKAGQLTRSEYYEITGEKWIDE